MIEPQNTMMPLAAEPATVDLPQGEEGFGAMLAQTLGMVPQLDPNAIQQIAGQQSEGGQDAADLTGESGQGVPGDRQPTRVGRYATIPTTGHVSVAKATPVKPAPIHDGQFVDPVYVKGQPPMPATLPEPGFVQEPVTLSQPHTPIQVPIEDGVGEPVLTGDTPRVVGDNLLKMPQPVAAPADPESLAVAPSTAGPSAGLEPVDPAPQPRPEPPPSAPVAPPVDVDPGADPVRPAPIGPVAAEPAQPVIVEQDPIAVDPARDLPADPAPVTARPTDAAPTSQAPSVQAAPTAPRQGDAPESTTTFRIEERPVQVVADNAVPMREGAVRIEGTGSTVPSAPNQMVVAESAGTPHPAVAATPVTTSATPIQHSALAERVMQAVEMQANQPPPRTMVVDIPEIEGLRLVVSVRGGAEVHVVPASASTATDGVQPFLEELQGVLENRGFVMTGDDRRRNGQRQNQDEPAPTRSARPTFRRAEPTDNDLRI